MAYGSVSPSTYKTILKFTVDGRPSVNDIHEYFSLLVSQVTFTTHKYMFRNYSHTFTSEDAILKLRSLNTSPDIYTRANLNLEKDMAKALIQQFLWSRLIEYAVDPNNRTYRDKGIWRLKSKGLCVLQEFCLKTNRADLISFFKNCVHAPSTDPIFLIHVERVIENDRMNRNKKYMSSLFAIMVASVPLRDGDTMRSNEKENEYHLLNTSCPKKISLRDTSFLDYTTYCESDLYTTFTEQKLSRQSSISSASTNFTSTSSLESNLITDYFPHLKIYANDLLIDTASSLKKPNKATSSLQQKVLLRNLRPSSSNKFKMRSIFTSLLCCEWLTGCCTIASNDEAESIMTEFLNLGWITFFDDKNKYKKEIESSKSIMLKLTGTGMKVIIDFSLESYESFQQNQKDEKSFATSLEKKRYSTASSSSSGYQTETTTLSKSISFSPDEPLYSSQPHVYSQKYPNTARDNTINKRDTHVKTPKQIAMVNHSNYNSAPCITESSMKQPVLDTGFHCNNITPFFIPSGDNMAIDDSYKESNSIKLKAILNDPKLCTLFRDFLRINLCAENLDFWIDYRKLRSKCRDGMHNSTAFSSKKQQSLIKDTYVLWSTFLAPNASRELNINHTLREDIAEEMSCIATVVNTGGTGTESIPTVIISMHSAQESLLSIMAWFEKVDDQICKLMASDSIPKFVRTMQYRELVDDTYPIQEKVEEKPLITHSFNSEELNYFPPPPQRVLKETLFL